MNFINNMQKQKLIKLIEPDLGNDELSEIRQVFKSGILTRGPKVEQFETLVGKFVGAKYALATTSATTALHLALAALGIGPGDEVLVPDYTFPATANVVVQLGAIPVLVDIDLDTFTIDLKDLEKKITKRSKAIMPVHAFGLSADMNPVNVLAKKHHLFVVEDAACALGTTYYGKRCGNLSDIGCFSFHPRKAITTGEGGMITTNSKRLADQMSLLRNHGGLRKNGRFTFLAAGYNYRLSDIQAAVGVAQMHKLPDILRKRTKRAQDLYTALKDIDGISLPNIPPWKGHVFQSFVILLDMKYNRDTVIENMKKKNIETTLGTYALHDQPFFMKQYGYKASDLKKSHYVYKHALTLPLYAQMTKQDINRIVVGLAESLKE
ncbi:glutamine--scyllo-inositol aminotransferase [Candidatus Roizmanbacteria bacterium CG_4_9_14_0_2_um_filter_39_13]|uniref:Glutamine--scyllo-inositol aminotransferase n=1 Tax=Candidatus Roizmanbacteria bacterium CG_4_9_14_0_2_um_filter_39_13 TaxID=1974839 RepID=A0A2M8EWD4_9BACT|nr:MAG: glutamine--scyllo-inositol aminotransferase [Candidatus Roizmanbacteria bacterium CG_4_9_14_0_2_um_filter_39_13]